MTDTTRTPDPQPEQVRPHPILGSPVFVTLATRLRRQAMFRSALTSAASVVPAAVLVAALSRWQYAVLVLLVGAPGTVWAVIGARSRAARRTARLRQVLATAPAGDYTVDPAWWVTTLRDAEAAMVTTTIAAVRSAEASLRASQAAHERAEAVEAGARAILQRRVRAEERLLASLAGELHDTAAQTLLVAQWSLEQGLDPKGVIDELRTAEQQLRDVLALAKLPTEDTDVATAVEEFLQRTQERTTARLSVADWPQTPYDVPAPVAAAAYRIIQEAVRNAIKHAAATNVTVSVQVVDDQQLVVTVADDGRGFDVNAVTATRGNHFGLGSMTDRAGALGGTVTVSSAPGEGAVVEAVVPLGVSR